jgi:hypothetical protein
MGMRFFWICIGKILKKDLTDDIMWASKQIKVIQSLKKATQLRGNCQKSTCWGHAKTNLVGFWKTLAYF